MVPNNHFIGEISIVTEDCREVPSCGLRTENPNTVKFELRFFKKTFRRRTSAEVVLRKSFAFF